MYENQAFNISSTIKNSKKQLVYQAPYFIEGKFSGIVEMVLDLPNEMLHFDRDKNLSNKILRYIPPTA